MRVLGLFLLAVLGCSLTEGLLVSKCDLRDQLLKTIGELWRQQKRQIVENVAAKIVCHVELASGFNTSSVNQLNPSHPDSETASPTRPPHLDEEVWTLYGLFQLSNHLVCSDGTTPSPNICLMECSNLVDDDTRDDISCLMKIIANLIEKGFSADHFKELRRMIRLIFQEECRDAQASEYFTECS